MTLLCQICGAEIPESRAVKKSRTCSVECAQEYDRRKSAERGEKACRLCGRRYRRARKRGAIVASVHPEHNGQQSAVVPVLSAPILDSARFAAEGFTASTQQSEILNSQSQKQMGVEISENSATSCVHVLCDAENCELLSGNPEQEMCETKSFTVSTGFPQALNAPPVDSVEIDSIGGR